MENKRTISGIKAFIEKYGECTPETISKFLGISEKQFVKKYWKIWKKNNENQIN